MAILLPDGHTPVNPMFQRVSELRAAVICLVGTALSNLLLWWRTGECQNAAPWENHMECQ